MHYRPASGRASNGTSRHTLASPSKALFVRQTIDFASLRDRFLEAQLSGDRREAMRLLTEEGIDQGASTSELALEVIQEAQRKIGKLWEENRISVADEHLATAIAQVTLANLYQHAKPDAPVGKTILVACVEGEQHDFPARLAADALELAGFRVRFLGADVPFDSLSRMVSRDKPDLVALSVTMSYNLPSLVSTVKRLRSTFGHEPPIIVGGYACNAAPSLLEDIDIDGTGRDALEFISVANRLLARRKL
jgi:MerR family transcriptional regulator, light-induced transcriptional regulator